MCVSGAYTRTRPAQLLIVHNPPAFSVYLALCLSQWLIPDPSNKPGHAPPPYFFPCFSFHVVFPALSHEHVTSPSNPRSYFLPDAFPSPSIWMEFISLGFPRCAQMVLWEHHIVVETGTLREIQLTIITGQRSYFTNEYQRHIELYKCIFSILNKLRLESSSWVIWQSCTYSIIFVFYQQETSLKSEGSPHPFPFYMCLFYLLTFLDPLKFVTQKDGCHSGIGRKRCFCK